MLLAIEGVRRLNELGVPSVEGEAILRYGLSIIPQIVSANSTENYALIKSELESKLVEARPCAIGGIVDSLVCDSPNKKFRVHANTYMGTSPGQDTKSYLANLFG